MELGKYLEERVANWDGLSRWEKSELGKDLRRAGLSYGEVMALIPVKKSTLATWCRKVRLTDEQYQAIKTRTGSQEGIPRDTNRKRRQEIELIQREARERARDLGCDPLFTAGVALYWGEGSKTSRRLEMAHSEPEALRFFMRWTRVFLHPDAAFAACLNLHAEQRRTCRSDILVH